MTQSNRILLAVVALVAAAGAYYMLVLSPKREQAATLQADIAKAETDLTAAQQLLAANEAAKAGYKDAYTAVVRLGKAVPADDDVRSLMVQLDEAAKRSDVDFRTIQIGGTSGAQTPAASSGSSVAQPLPPGTAIGPAGFPMMPFSFTFKGSFFKLSDFLSRLDRFVTARNDRIGVTGRLLTLDSIQLETDQTTGYPNIKASVGATSFLVSPLEGATGGATAQGPAAAQQQASAPETDGATPPTTTATTTGAFK